MKKFVYFLLSFALFAHILITNVVADNGSYQAPVVNRLTIDKKILLQSTQKGLESQWLDNISHDRYQFALGENIHFQITIHNPTNHQIDNISFTDRAPWAVNLTIDGASYDTYSNSYTVNLGSLASGESKSFVLSGTIRSDAYSLPHSALTCLDNYAFVSTNGSALDDDMSNFCIKRDIPTPQKISTPPQNIPATGAPLLFPLLGLAAGMFVTGKKLIQE